MGYTTPRTYVVGEVHQSAHHNTYERDNVSHLHGDGGTVSYGVGPFNFGGVVILNSAYSTGVNAGEIVLPNNKRIIWATSANTGLGGSLYLDASNNLQFSVGGVEFSAGGIRVDSNWNPAGGAGLELHYTGAGSIIAYDRSGATYKNLSLNDTLTIVGGNGASTFGGNVGINTAPSVKLHIVSSAGTGDFRMVTGNIEIHKDSTPTKGWAVGMAPSGGAVTDDLLIGRYNGSSWATVARMYNSGGVAVGNPGDPGAGILAVQNGFTLAAGQAYFAPGGSASSPTVAVAQSNTGLTQIAANTIEMVANGTRSTQWGSNFYIPSFDNTSALGGSGQRWAVVWAVNGTIQTSNPQDKQVLRALAPNEALRVLRGLKAYRFHYLAPDGTPHRQLVHTGVMWGEAHPDLFARPGGINPTTLATYAAAGVDALVDALLAKGVLAAADLGLAA